MKTKYIERGWESYRRTVVPRDAGQVQVNETRQAYYAGAAILFETIMRMLDPGQEPTDADLKKMSAVYDELAEFGQSLDVKMFKTSEH